MKRIALTLLFVPILFACTSNNGNSKNNIAIVEKYVKSVENLDYKTMESLLDDSYYGFGPSYGDSIDKIEAIENWKTYIETLYESIHYNKSRNVAITIKDGDNKGEWVSNWGELHIVYKNNGGEFTIWANTIYLIENGKIVKSYTFYNEKDALSQLGYVFIDPNNL